MKAIFLVALIAPLCGAQTASEPSFNGTWVEQNDKAVKLIVDQTDNKIHVQEMKGNQLISEYTCTMDGKDCNFSEDGHPAKVSLWFNGPKLIEFRTLGKDTIRRRFSLSPDGKDLSVELTPLTSAGKDETVQYTRQ